MRRLLMQLKVADAVWPTVPSVGLIHVVFENYKVIGFDGIAVRNDDHDLHPQADIEAGKTLIWFRRGRPSE